MLQEGRSWQLAAGGMHQQQRSGAAAQRQGRPAARLDDEQRGLRGRDAGHGAQRRHGAVIVKLRGVAGRGPEVASGTLDETTRRAARCHGSWRRAAACRRLCTRACHTHPTTRPPRCGPAWRRWRAPCARWRSCASRSPPTSPSSPSAGARRGVCQRCTCDSRAQTCSSPAATHLAQPRTASSSTVISTSADAATASADRRPASLQGASRNAPVCCRPASTASRWRPGRRWEPPPRSPSPPRTARGRGKPPRRPHKAAGGASRAMPGDRWLGGPRGAEHRSLRGNSCKGRHAVPLRCERSSAANATAAATPDGPQHRRRPPPQPPSPRPQTISGNPECPTVPPLAPSRALHVAKGIGNARDYVVCDLCRIERVPLLTAATSRPTSRARRPATALAASTGLPGRLTVTLRRYKHAVMQSSRHFLPPKPANALPKKSCTAPGQHRPSAHLWRLCGARSTAL